jgi:hypothetical protein
MFQKWNGYPLLHYAVLQPWHFACLRKYSQANLRIINWILKIPHIDVNVKDQVRVYYMKFFTFN